MSPLDDEDLALHTLNGLPDSYDAFKTTICTRPQSITVENLCSLLCTKAIHIESKLKSPSGSDLTVAFSATKKTNFSQESSPSKNSRNFNNSNNYSH